MAEYNELTIKLKVLLDLPIDSLVGQFSAAKEIDQTKAYGISTRRMILKLYCSNNDESVLVNKIRTVKHFTQHDKNVLVNMIIILDLLSL